MAIFYTVKVVYIFSREMDGATFWATFSQTHLVTLAKRTCLAPLSQILKEARFPRGISNGLS
jgi:hypothetical protein